MLALLLLLSASAFGAERTPTQELVRRCAGAEKLSAADFVFSGLSPVEAQRALIQNSDLQVAGAVVAPARRGVWVGFEVYRKDLTDQRYAIAGVLVRERGKVRVLKSTAQVVDLGFRHHLLGFYPELQMAGDPPLPLRVCRTWMGDPDHFYREFLFLLVPGDRRNQLLVGLRTLMTESDKFGESSDSVTLREASVTAIRGTKGLVKKLNGTNLQIRFQWRQGHYEFENQSVKDPLIPTPSDGP